MEKCYCIKWTTDLQWSDVRNYLQPGMLCDVFLVAEDGTVFSANQMVLILSSEYFRKIFSQLKTSSTGKEITFVLKDIPALTLQLLLEFVVKGSVMIAQSQVKAFVEAATSLKIRGIVAPPQHNLEDSHNNAGRTLVSDANAVVQSSEVEKLEDSLRSQEDGTDQETPGNQVVPQEKSHEVDQFNTSNNDVIDDDAVVSIHDSVVVDKEYPVDTPADSQGEVETISDEAGRASSNQSSRSPHEQKSVERNRTENTKVRGSLDDSDSDVQFIKVQKSSGQNKLRYKKYSESQIQKALAEVLSGKLKCYPAAKKYGIPSRTLYSRIKKRSPAERDDNCSLASGEKFTCSQSEKIENLSEEDDFEQEFFPPSPVPLTLSQKLQRERRKKFYADSQIQPKFSTPQRFVLRPFEDPKEEMPSPIESMSSSVASLNQSSKILGI